MTAKVGRRIAHAIMQFSDENLAERLESYACHPDVLTSEDLLPEVLVEAAYRLRNPAQPPLEAP